jgi:NAD(P)-dependent dehydrogenase (short-subunit alcohol dehydrogenase family)
MGGIITFPGIGYCRASKFALESLSEALGKEVKSFGIAVTAVEPGGFRTDWAGRSMVRTGRKIADYDAVFGPLRKARQAKTARAMFQLIASDNPPAHLIAGSRRGDPRARETRYIANRDR